MKASTKVLSQAVRGGNTVSIKKTPFAAKEAKEGLGFTSKNGSVVNSPEIFVVTFSIVNSNKERFSEKLMIDSAGVVGKFSKDEGTSHSSFKADTGLLKAIRHGMLKSGLTEEVINASINVLIKAIQ